MKDTFQAKDIQNILLIPKHRYEYIASKIGITPEVDEVERQGHVHLYSFKNLLQFGFAHHGNKLGLTPKATRTMLSNIDEFEKSEHFGIYDPNKKESLSIHYIEDGFILSVSDIVRKVFLQNTPVMDEEMVSTLRSAYDSYEDLEIRGDYNKIEPVFWRVGESSVMDVIRACTGSITINLGLIKGMITNRLIGYK